MIKVRNTTLKVRQRQTYSVIFWWWNWAPLALLLLSIVRREILTVSLLMPAAWMRPGTPTPNNMVTECQVWWEEVCTCWMGGYWWGRWCWFWRQCLVMPEWWDGAHNCIGCNGGEGICWSSSQFWNCVMSDMVLGPTQPDCVFVPVVWIWSCRWWSSFCLIVSHNKMK
jgi:hypothetical protein